MLATQIFTEAVDHLGYKKATVVSCQNANGRGFAHTAVAGAKPWSIADLFNGS